MARQDLLGLSVSHRRGLAPRLLHRGSDALVLALIMVLALRVWAGIPLGWLPTGTVPFLGSGG